MFEQHKMPITLTFSSASLFCRKMIWMWKIQFISLLSFFSPHSRNILFTLAGCFSNGRAMQNSVISRNREEIVGARITFKPIFCSKEEKLFTSWSKLDLCFLCAWVGRSFLSLPVHDRKFQHHLMKKLFGLEKKRVEKAKGK